MALNFWRRNGGSGWNGSFLGRNNHVGEVVGQGPQLTQGTFYPTQVPVPARPFNDVRHRKSVGCRFKLQKPGPRKFNGKNNKNSQINFPLAVEIDLTKPWVTEKIKIEDIKKQEFLEAWKKTKSDENWNKYQEQKLVLQTLYNKAKGEYIATHPHDPWNWINLAKTQNYFCEICDKSFKTYDALILHEAEHETCGIDGCEYTAHSNLIAKHIKMQHDSGLYKKIGKIQSEEDIAKWIEERKKRYPSRKVIEEKKALEQEKMERGERIKNDNSKFNKSFQNKYQKNKHFGKKNSPSLKKKKVRKNKKVVSTFEYLQEEENCSVRNGVPAFLGTKKSVESEKPESPESDLGISDEEWEAEDKVKNTINPKINSSLGLLAACYDSEEETSEKISLKENKLDEEDEGSEPEEVKNVYHQDPCPKENALEKKPFKRKNNREEKNMSKNKKMKSSLFENNAISRDLTLLEKLLKNEIRHERNLILQCVHYIVKNNFFKG